jgi:hypothetical protein
VDAPGGFDGGRDYGSEREETPFGRAESGSGPGDPNSTAIPVGAPQPELIGSESSGSQNTFDGATIPAWTGGGPVAAVTAPERCKFLRTIGSDGKLSDAGREAVPTHRCAAFGDPLPLSLRQQELVCLQKVHVSCPRYMRGTLLAEESAAEEAEKPARTPMPWLTIAGLILIAVVGLVAIVSMAGLLPGTGSGPAPTSSQIAAVTTSSPSTAESPTVDVTDPPTASASPSDSPAPSASPSPTATPSPTLAPTPKPTASWPPGATASRMNLLTACPGQTDCWIYTVRSGRQNGSGVNDTVQGIARYFGVTTRSIYQLNPWALSGIKPGDKLKIPNPTR